MVTPKYRDEALSVLGSAPASASMKKTTRSSSTQLPPMTAKG
ncbi:hypothetical protein [uncultured Megasphaera sp.]|nr:hypothetical protein [uncultured Megasphaera sp.]